MSAAVESRVAQNYRAVQEVQAVTESGIRVALDRLSQAGTGALPGFAGPDGRFASATGLAGMLQSDDAPLIPGSPAMRLTGEPYLDSSGAEIGRYHVFLSNNVAEGRASVLDADETVSLSAFGSAGLAARAVAVEAHRLRFPRFPAALMLAASNGTWAGPLLPGFRLSAVDLSGAGAGEVPVGTLGPAPFGTDVSSRLDRRLLLPRALKRFESFVRRLATDRFQSSGTPAVVGHVGSASDWRIVHVDGDGELSGAGYGLLLVTGRLTVRDGSAWTGLILVIGQGELIWSGFSQIQGAIFLANAGPPGGTVHADLSAAQGGLFLDTAAVRRAGDSLPFGVTGYWEP